MKQTIAFNKYILVILMFSSVLHAQGTKSKDEWKQQMQDATAKREILQKDISTLEMQIQTMKKNDAILAEELLKGNANLKELQANVDRQSKEYRQMLTNIQNMLASLEKTTKHHHRRIVQKQLDSLQAILGVAKSRRASLVTENLELLKKLQNELDAVRGLYGMLLHNGKDDIALHEYVVGSWKDKRDCLWNIAKNSKIYHNPYLWPKIWQANEEKIANPDLLTRGEILTIPAKGSLTQSEKSALQAYLEHHTHGHHIAHVHKDSKTHG